MPLHNPKPRIYERQLAYGLFGTGKTHNWLRIARLALKTKSDMQFHVLDADNAVGFTISENEAFHGLNAEDGGNVHIYDVFDWETYTQEVDRVRSNVNEQDFVIWDKLTDMWEWVQDHYTRERYGTSQADYFLSWRTEHGSKKGNEYEGDTDWKVINSLYREYVSSRILRGRHNIFATASAKATDSDPKKGRDPKEIQSIFGKYPLRPEGQKSIGQMFHSIFMLQEKPKGFQITTVRERGTRNKYEGEDWNGKDFATNYLLQRAGWKLK